jgi:transposase
LGKRERRRKLRRDVEQIVALEAEGYSAETIASTLGLRAEFVYRALQLAEHAREVFEGEGMVS